MVDRDMPLKKKISMNIEKYRKEMKWTQKELADKADIPKSTLSDYINCKTLINAGNVEKLANTFNISKSDIDPSFGNKEDNKYDMVHELEQKGIIINFSDYDGFEQLSDDEKIEFQKKIEEAVQFELFKRNNNKK
ncbi:helix-turn-helix domain-containing protein [Macrococcus armenti]|uniref:helix-turn-helix domain-containing protein n=1 Tax=Macrococcus armenti TaxID=2875764 RepID=UPI001CD47EE0|nr:helix-turn-helix domain-containing protein [Macrococcus armenti]UBH10637.1 helix-turn-helix domain-containing protein [Macrococcus armenti]